MARIILEQRPYEEETIGRIPHYGGLLHVNVDTGIAHCCACDWRGVPNVLRSEVDPNDHRWDGSPQRPRIQPIRHLLNVITDTVCPNCHVGELGPEISRNAPCPCGSNKKYKKCCGAS